MTDTARAVFFAAPRQVEIRDVPLAAGEGGRADGCYDICITTMAISAGTELLIYRGQQPTSLVADASIASLAGSLDYPLRYGYSAVGTVTAGAQAGKRVFAFHPHQDRAIVPAADCLDLPDSLGDEDAALLPLMETAITLVHDAAPRYGETALVVGLGVVGLLTARLLGELGCDVIGVEPRPERRQRAERHGCRAVEPTGAGAAVDAATGGRGVDVAVEVSGAPDAMQTGIDSLAFGGTLVAASWLGTRAASLDLGAAFHRKRLQIRSSQVSSIDPALSGRWDKPRLLQLAIDTAARLQPAQYVTHRFPLERAQEAFELLDGGDDGVLQVLLCA